MKYFTINHAKKKCDSSLCKKISNLNLNNPYSNNINGNFNDSPIKKRKIRNKFTPEEDHKLRELVKMHGDRSWNTISSLMKNRSQRQCRERWKHYLSCDSNESQKPWTKEEDLILLTKYNELGAKWTKIARELPGRSDLQVKIRYMKHLSIKTVKNEEISLNDFIPEEKNKEVDEDIFLNDEIKFNFPGIQQKKENKDENNNENSSITESILSNFDLNFQVGFDLPNSNLLADFCNNNFFNHSFQAEVWPFE